MAKAFRTEFKCVLVEPDYQGAAINTSIYVRVPSGLTREQARDYVVGRITGELSRYAAWEGLGLGPTDNSTDWSEIVT
jgi:hypothetical protein